MILKTKDKYLRNVMCRVPYYSHELNPKQVEQLETHGSTVLTLPLRFNYPLLTGIKFGNEIATITNKRLKKGKWEYYLEGDLHTKPYTVTCKNCGFKKEIFKAEEIAEWVCICGSTDKYA